MGKLRRGRGSAGQSPPPRPQRQLGPRPPPPPTHTQTHRPWHRCGGRGWVSSADRVPPKPALQRPSSGGRRPRYEAPGHTQKKPARADGQPRCPHANKRRVCRERGGRPGPGAERGGFDGAAHRGGGDGARAGAGIDPAQLLPTVPLEPLTRGPHDLARPPPPRPQAGIWGPRARQGRNPNVAGPQLRRWERPDGETWGRQARSLAGTLPDREILTPAPKSK